MLIDPADLEANLDTLEDIEKASTRLVTQAILDFREEAAAIFGRERDLPQDFAEDITREALDQMGVSRIPQRLSHVRTTVIHSFRTDSRFGAG